MSVFRASLLISIIPFLFSCTTNEEQAKAPEVSNDFRSFEVNPKAVMTDVPGMIADIEVMGLQETDSSLLSYVTSVNFHKDLMVFSSNKESKIFVYSADGGFIRSFGGLGDGPAQYSDNKSTWMNGDTVLVYDYKKKAVQYYSLEGAHLKTRKLNFMPNHVRTFGGLWLMDASFEAIDDSLQYKLLITDETQGKRQMEIPYDLLPPFPVYEPFNAFRPYGKDMTFNPPFHDTIYLVTRNAVKPFYSVDFGDQWLWKDKWLYENPNGVMGEAGKRGQVWVFRPFTGSEFIFIQGHTSFSDYFIGLITRSTGQFTRLKPFWHGDSGLQMKIIGWFEDRFLFSVSSPDLVELIDQLNPEQVSVRGEISLEEMEASENPVFMWVKFKAL